MSSKPLQIRNSIVKAVPPYRQPHEYKIVSLRECPTPANKQQCDTPKQAVDYWRLHVERLRYFNPDCECLIVLILDVRHRIKGHHLVSIGTLDTVLTGNREVFRLAVMTAASGIVIMHNHPSGDPDPSEGDIKFTRSAIKAGKILGIQLCDSIIMGNPGHYSLREKGYFFN